MTPSISAYLRAASIASLGLSGFTQAQKPEETQGLTPASAVGNSNFGRAWASSGKHVVGGAPTARSSGRAYVFEERNAGPDYLVETAELASSDASPNDRFGWDVDVFGDRLAVGARGDDDLGSLSGSVYVFDRDPLSGLWTETVKLTASNGAAGDEFGRCLALDAEVLAVGAFRNDEVGMNSGAVYVFERVGTTWTEVQRLTVPSPVGGELFGSQLALDGTTLLVAAVGSQTVFSLERGPAGWVFDQTIPSFGDPGAWGHGLALRDDRAAVTNYDANTAPSGYVILFERSSVGAAWTQTASLGAIPNFTPTSFGSSADIAEDRVLVGSGNFAPYAGLLEYDPVSGQWLGQHFGQDPVGGGAALTALGQAVFGSKAYVSSADLPVPYCTAKTASVGCQPLLGWSGTPSESDPNAFTVDAANLLNQTQGLLFYGLSGRTLSPFGGGALCVAPPLRRTPLASTAGSLAGADCSGGLAFDFNAWLQSGSDPLLGPGSVVDLQGWSRDPQHPDGTGVGLTGAMEFTIEP